MKLIIKQYIASLKERGELDELLPDLLSQMGLNVFSRPGRGTRQYGVDIGAVGSIEKEPETVYLLSVKPGDLTRKDWNSGSPQDLQPSLDEILTVYIHSHLPPEHKGKPISICICIGGDIKEEVRLNVTQYEETKKTDTINIVEWDGDRLASMIESYLLREDLLPNSIRPLLRKSLALLDEPEASFRHFSKLIKSFSGVGSKSDAQLITSIRQLNICLWILFAWARDTGNLEAAYLSGESTLLHAWELTKGHSAKRNKAAESIQSSFFSILNVYQLICRHYLAKKIIPHAGKLHGLSSAVRSSNKIDVNLKLFDVLGRLATSGIWSYWNASIGDKEYEERKQVYDREMDIISQAIKILIHNNPILLLPFKDDHAIDISLTLLFLSLKDSNEGYMNNWLKEMMERAIFAYKCHGPYPCILDSYRDLLEHPKRGDDEYRKEVTAGSILYPTIALWAALLKENDLYEKVKAAKDNHFRHCNFQFWYPDETSEDCLYINSDLHGAVLSDVRVDLSPKEFLEAVWTECDHTNHFDKLSAREHGFWPLILVACRHYRIPVPLHFTLSYREALHNKESQMGEVKNV